MGKGAGINEELDQEEKNNTLLQRSLNSLNSVVVGTKDQNGQNDVVRDFNNNIGEEEGLPGICFARSFADFVERALTDEERHDLVHCVSRDFA